MKSMTGFGKAEYFNDKRKITIEIKTLNSKQFDLTVKIPNVWRDRELLLRNELISNLQRGKIELHITIDESFDEIIAQFNETAIVNYYRQLFNIAVKNNIPLPPDILNSIVRMPDVLALDRQEANENEWQILVEGVQQALLQVNDFRQQEGIALKEDISCRIKLIESYLLEVEKLEPQRIEFIKNRLNQNLIEYVGENNIDNNRFEQELIYYLEKIDVNEEKVRLRSHCSYFL